MEHYFVKNPKSAKKDSSFAFSLNSIEFKFQTSSSVFSKDKLDKGTLLLINESTIEPGSSILDLGCGYGPVGIVLKKLNPDIKVTMSDINERAISLASKNKKTNKVDTKIIDSNLYEDIQEKFDAILCNPPQSAGKKICIDIIKGAKKHLNKKGTLQLVVRHQKGGKHLAKIMEKTFGNVETIARKSGYHIYLSRN